MLKTKVRRIENMGRDHLSLRLWLIVVLYFSLIIFAAANVEIGSGRAMFTFFFLFFGFLLWNNYVFLYYAMYIFFKKRSPIPYFEKLKKKKIKSTKVQS